MSTKIRVEFRLSAGWREDKEAGVFVAWCPALDVRSQGETSREACDALKAALITYITVCYNRNILDNVLNSHGFKFTPDGSVPGTATDSESDFINVTDDRHEYPHTFDVDLDLQLAAMLKRQPASAEACPS